MARLARLRRGRGLRRRRRVRAFGLPTPKTMFVRALCSLHRVQLGPMSARMRSSESFSIFSSKSDGLATAGMKTGAALGEVEVGGSGARRAAAASSAGDGFAAGADICGGVPTLPSGKGGAPGTASETSAAVGCGARDRGNTGRGRDFRRSAAMLRRECDYFGPRRFRLSGRSREFTRAAGAG